MRTVSLLLLAAIATASWIPGPIRAILSSALGAVAFGPDSGPVRPTPGGATDGFTVATSKPAPAPPGYLRYRYPDGGVGYVRDDPVARARIPIGAVRF